MTIDTNAKAVSVIDVTGIPYPARPQIPSNPEAGWSLPKLGTVAFEIELLRRLLSGKDVQSGVFYIDAWLALVPEVYRYDAVCAAQDAHQLLVEIYGENTFFTEARCDEFLKYTVAFAHRDIERKDL